MFRVSGPVVHDVTARLPERRRYREVSAVLSAVRLPTASFAGA
jgi:hypothetical protein